MNINFEIVDNAALLGIEGRLDTITAPELEEVLNTGLAEAETLTIDCAGLEYISSAGLRVLLSAHKKMSVLGGMKLINANEMVREIFEITGFSEILTIE